MGENEGRKQMAAMFVGEQSLAHTKWVTTKDISDNFVVNNLNHHQVDYPTIATYKHTRRFINKGLIM